MNKIVDKEQLFLKNFENEKLEINFNGHQFNPHFVNESITVHKNFIEIIKGRKNKEEMKSFGYINQSFINTATCTLCGRRMGVKLADEKHVNVFTYPKVIRAIDEKEFDYSPCKMQGQKINSFELNFPTGKVAINNIFKHPTEHKYLFNVPASKEYIDEYSLESVLGRFNKQNYIAQNFNVGYGQMSNMSFDVFISSDKKRLVFAEEPFEDSDELNLETEAWNEKFEAEFTKVGHICCDVWHWECADEQVLKDNGYKGGRDVLVDVVPGKYQVTHFFDSSWHDSYASDRYNIYSEFVLKD